MEWTKPKPPTKGESYYDHCTCETPIGAFKIEWKSWKDSPSYDVMLDEKWICVEYSLEEAQRMARQYIESVQQQLTDFLYRK